MDIVYIFREGPMDSFELKYSIRSITTNVSFDNIYVVGDKPKWITNITHIKVDDPTVNKFYNIIYKIKEVTKIKELSEDFVIMWDDIYAISKINEFRHYSDGLMLKEVVSVKKGINPHRDSLKRVLDIYSNGINYDVHHPYIYNKLMLKKLFLKHKINPIKPYAIRSLYCNLYNIEYELVKNCKCNTYENFVNIKKNNTFVSSNKTLLSDKRFRDYMETNFNEKTKYEK